MKSAIWKVLVVAVGTFTCATAQADLIWSGRVGPLVGWYEYEDSGVVNGTPTQSVEAEGFLVGLATGLGFSFGSFFTDFGLEYFTLVDTDVKPEGANLDFDRTDGLVTLGYGFGMFSVFGGYRNSWQGDGPFDDETFKESGPFIGAGMGFALADNWDLGLSLAYNSADGENAGSEFLGDFDVEGWSLKAQASKANHALLFRLQRFEGERDGVFQGITFSSEYEEQWFQVGYLFLFP